MVRRLAWLDLATYAQGFEEKPQCSSISMVGTPHRTGTSTSGQMLPEEAADCFLANLSRRKAGAGHPVPKVRDATEIVASRPRRVSAFFKKCLIKGQMLGQHTLVQPRDRPMFHNVPPESKALRAREHRLLCAALAQRIVINAMHRRTRSWR